LVVLVVLVTLLKIKRLKYSKLIIWLTLALTLPSQACQPQAGSDIPILVFPPKYDSAQPEQDYVFQLIQLILTKSSDKFGPCEARLLDHKLPLKRIVSNLQNNQLIDTASLTVSHERDKKLLPISIPIAKGLIGYRLLMIHNDDVAKFSQVKSLADLGKHLAGQGVGWADVEILEKNRLPVLTTGSIKTLIDMLVHHRFDYFPRGALQITTEIQTYRDKPVMVEPSIVLRYPSMTALYVNGNNLALAQRLEYGLKKAFEHGSFDKFFNAHPSSVQALSNLDLANRIVLKMCNPILPAWVPIEKSEYWIEPWSEKLLAQACK